MDNERKKKKVERVGQLSVPDNPNKSRVLSVQELM